MSMHDWDGTTTRTLRNVNDYDGTATRELGTAYDYNGTTTSLLYRKKTIGTLFSSQTGDALTGWYARRMNPLNTTPYWQWNLVNSAGQHWLRFPGNFSNNTTFGTLIVSASKLTFHGAGRLAYWWGGDQFGGGSQIYVACKDTNTANWGASIELIWFTAVPGDNWTFGQYPPNIATKMMLWDATNRYTNFNWVYYNGRFGQNYADYNVTGDFYLGIYVQGYDFTMGEWIMSDLIIQS